MVIKYMYYAIFAFMSVFSFFEVSKSPSNVLLAKRSQVYKIIFWGIAVFLVLFAGLRGELGTDYNTNLRYYESLLEGTGSINSIEPAYFVLARFLKSYENYILIIAVIAVLTKAIFIYKESEYAIVSLTLYYSYAFLQFDMGIIRQGLAIACTFWAVKYIENRQLTRFLLICLAAMMFHYSAMIFIPTYFIVSKKLSRKLIYGVSIIAVMLSFTDFWRVITYVLNIFSMFGFDKYSWYWINDAYRAHPFEILDLQKGTPPNSV